MLKYYKAKMSGVKIESVIITYWWFNKRFVRIPIKDALI